MTHIEVVREAHESFDKVRKAIAQLSEYLADEGYGPRYGESDPLENGYDALRILDSLEAELAQARETLERERELAAAAIKEALHAAIQVREERDVARHTLRMLQNPEYRAALTEEAP